MAEVAISDAEWLVMRVVWRLGKATAADVIGELGKTQDWNHRTIRTLLGRLVEKGALATESDGHRYVYRPRVTQQKCVRAESRSFLNKVFGGDARELLVHFAQDAQITPEQIDELKRLLDSKRSARD
jgi:BlaI family penicillinase repressor